MSKQDFTIFRYSTMLALTRAGITTFAELEKMSNAEVANETTEPIAEGDQED